MPHSTIRSVSTGHPVPPYARSVPVVGRCGVEGAGCGVEGGGGKPERSVELLAVRACPQLHPGPRGARRTRTRRKRRTRTRRRRRV
eukprot:2480452-Rhodomonas_salina.1